MQALRHQYPEGDEAAKRLRSRSAGLPDRRVSLILSGNGRKTRLRKLDGDRRWAENASLTSAPGFPLNWCGNTTAARCIVSTQPTAGAGSRGNRVAPVRTGSSLKTSLRSRVSRSRLNFRDLLVVPHRVQRYVDQPLVRVQRIEHRHRMLDGKLL